jgi:hypothetical protein
MVIKEFEPLVVSRVPAVLETDKLYLCFECSVVIHLCACGCGEKVVLPIDPDEWKITYFDGESVTLDPSIGNFRFPCRSHYFIRYNKVVWADTKPDVHTQTSVVPPAPVKRPSLWQRIKNRIRKLF